MPKSKDIQIADDSFTCPNSSCGLVFSKPLKVKDLSQDSECYDGCPRCLTAIAVDKSVPEVESISATPDSLDTPDTPDTSVERDKIVEIVSRIKDAKVEPPKPTSCSHKLGYLGQRSKNEKIPDECMVCENIVKCMMKNVEGLG